MISKTTLISLPLVFLAGLGAYRLTVVTRAETPTATAPAAHSATDALMNWLGATDAQRIEMTSDDERFAQDLGRLRAELQTQRNALAAALENTHTPDTQIESHVEAVIAADNAVQRRVARYLLAVRPHLSAEQQRRLFGLCAEGVRQGQGRRGRGGHGSIEAEQGADSDRSGRGFRYRGGRTTPAQ